MVKLVALYKYPEDVETFDKHYFNIHLPLTQKMPGLLKVEVTRFQETPLGEKSPYHLQAELYFENMDQLKTSMASPEGRAAAKDIWKLASNLVTMIIGEVVEDEAK